jgi:hypothetical protein
MYGCPLELRLVQELRLRDLGDLVSYGLPQELRLRDPMRSRKLRLTLKLRLSLSEPIAVKCYP